MLEHQLPDMLPRSDCTVFTHADIAPRNIMIDEQNKITGILDWEYYPDYWGYAQRWDTFSMLPGGSCFNRPVF
ncbi:hypothetical protein V8E54_010422 [Elaphomyces granulatus]|jgi:hypothetical protein